MDSVDGLLPIGFGLLCIFLINFLWLQSSPLHAFVKNM